MNSFSSHIARTSLVYYVTVLILSVRGIVLVPILLHTFGAASYAVYALALSGISYGAILVQFGLDSSIYQYLTPLLRSDDGKQVYWTAIQTTFGFGLLLVAAALIAGHFIADVLAARLVPLCAIVASGQVLWGLALTPFRCEERSGTYMGASMSTNVGDLAITVIVTVVTRNLLTVFFILAVYHVAIASVTLTVQASRLPFSFWVGSRAIQLLRFGWNGLINQLIVAGYFVWDRTIVSVAAGLSATAAYVPGVALGAAILPLAGTSTFTLPTLLVRPHIQRSANLKRSILRQAIRQYAMLAVPAATGAALIARPFLNIITTPVLAAIGTRVAWIASAAVMASGLSRFALLALRADHEDRWLSRSLVLHFLAFAAMGVGLSYFWPRQAPVLVAASILFTNFSQAAWAFRRLGHYVTNVLAPSLFLTPVIGTIAFSWLHIVFRTRGLAGLASIVLVSVAIYVVAIMVLERMSPKAFLKLIRKPVAFDEPGWDQKREHFGRQPIVLYAGPNHLFASAGIFYAAELAIEFDVHVILDEYGRQSITQPMLDALARRNIHVHWLPDLRGIRKHEGNPEFAGQLIENIRPAAVFSSNDMGPFEIVLARYARAAGAKIICFQTGAYAASLRADYEVLTRAQGTLWARRYGLPSEVGRRYAIARRHLAHLWHYYLGPLLAGYPPFPGPSSIFLRRGESGLRDGEAVMIYQKSAVDIAMYDGTPREKIVVFDHFLTRPEGMQLFLEIFPAPSGISADAALLLFDAPSALSTAEISSEGWDTPLIEAIGLLAEKLSSLCPQVLIKPHPALGREQAFLARLRQAIAKVPNAIFIDPVVNAVGLLPLAKIVIGEQSTVLSVARFMPDIIVISTNFVPAKRVPFHADPDGIVVFENICDVLAADLTKLRPAAIDYSSSEGSIIQKLEGAGLLFLGRGPRRVPN